MEEITREDLRQFRLLLLRDIEVLLDEKITKQPADKAQEERQEWLRSKSVRSILNISPATLQNLRVTGKIGHRKVMGTYYYSRKDLTNLFKNDKQR